MKSKSKIQVVALAFAMLVFISCFVTLTCGKYVVDQSVSWGDDQYLDYTVNSVFQVKSQDELFEAINQGYTYVQLDKEIENPLIVTQKAENLNRDLILDLNGIEIQRNGQEPILNVMEGVRLTVLDTSAEQTGGLYNPVGSVFNINGGTLTIVTGAFESGPRYSEYYTYNSSVLAQDNQTTKRTVVENDARDVVWHQNGTFQQKLAPIIKSYPTKTGEIKYNHGNLYFDTTVSKGAVTINPDTYCYYRTSENAAGSATETTMADWYYTYFVKQEDYSYAFAQLPTTYDEGKTIEDYVEITIYGYENVVKKASEIDKQENYYAAIQMSEGVLDVQDGSFFQYFGLSNTACVNSGGGEINVTQGTFSSRVPDATKYNSGAVIAKESDRDAFNATYFDNFNWQDNNGGFASGGESYCILNYGEAQVSIGKCQLFGSNNNIVGMQGGKLSIGDGNFTKKLTNKLKVSPTDEQLSAISVYSGSLEISKATCTVSGEKSCGIIMQDGTLSVSDTSFDIKGNDSCGIAMAKGDLDVNGSSFTVIGEKTTGIYSTISSGSFAVANSTFAINGTDAKGIYSENGQVQVISDNSATIAVDGENAIGIEVTNGGSVVSEGYVYSINGTKSMGIYATESASRINIDGGSVIVSSDNTFGIKSSIKGENFTVKNFAVTMSNGNNQVGIYSENGTVSATATDSATIIVSSDNGKGIYVGANGNVVSKNYEYKLSGTNSYGIYSEAGTVQMDGGKIEVESGVSSYGVYAVSQQQLTMDINGTEISVGYNDTTDKTQNTAAVQASIGVFLSSAAEGSGITLTNVNVKSLEVGVAANGGPITMCGKGSIETKYASAIAIRGGNITFENGSEYQLTSNNTTSDASENIYNLTVPVFEQNDSGVYELKHTDYRNTDGIYVNGGQFSSYGNLTVTHTGLQNATTSNEYDENYKYYSLVVTSYALRVLGGNVTITKGKFTATAGGGIYSGTTTLNGENKSGNVTLGTATSTVGDITVDTKGCLVGKNYHALGTSISNGWQSKQSVTGGHAVEVEGGDITVYNGKYTAQFGNGILANGKGKINIYDGEFYGYMNYKTTVSDEKAISLTGKSGPSAFYGLNVVGGAQVQIYGGTFDGGNGGAFVTGVTGVSGGTITAHDTARVLVYAGTFGGTSTIDAFNVYDDAIVVFGAYGADYFGTADASTISGKIKMYCSGAAIAANGITQDSKVSEVETSSIYVYYGTYGGYFWNDGKAKTTYSIYNHNSNVGYTVVSASNVVQGSVQYPVNNTTPEFNRYTIDELTK